MEEDPWEERPCSNLPRDLCSQHWLGCTVSRATLAEGHTRTCVWFQVLRVPAETKPGAPVAPWLCRELPVPQ